MNHPNANDPLEELLRNQPLEKVPPGVYERLQAKAAWNKPPASRWPLFLGTLFALTFLALSLLITLPSPEPPPPVPEPAAPIIVPAASAPVVALAPSVPTTAQESSDDLADQVGGLSTRWSRNEPPFALGFGAPIDVSSSRLDGLGS